MKRAVLSYLSSYKMSYEDVLHFLEEHGFDLSKEYVVNEIDDGHAVEYVQGNVVESILSPLK